MIKLPYEAAQKLYPDNEIKVQLVDSDGLLQRRGSFPGNPQRYSIGIFPLHPNVITHMELTIFPIKGFGVREFPVWLYYLGRRYDSSIFIEFNPEEPTDAPETKELV